MKKLRNPSRLRLLFVAAVLLPCLVLGVIAVRAIGREEAFVTMQLQQTLDAEIVYTVSLMNSELDRILEELAASSPAGISSSPETDLAAWKSRSELVRVPFLLTAILEIAWPRPGPALTEDDRAFLNWNREFVTGQVPIPVYQNIASFYKDEITKLQDPPAKTGEPVPGGVKAGPEAAASANEERGLLSAARPGTPDPKSRMKEAQVEQKALTELEKNPDIRQQVYDQARAMGQQTETRNVAPSPALSRERRDAPRESIFISEPLRFSEITADADRGIIPRFIEEKLALLFWERDAAGGFVGCIVEEDAVRGRLAGLIPSVYTPARILTILDENGRPLLTAENDEGRDWRRPFAAREISERLPRWEVAAYLTDPAAVASRAGTTTFLLWTLVLFLFAAIAGGGSIVLHTLRSEMQLARQKTTFVANVSHELKTPLTSIRMFAEILKERRQPDRGKREKYLDLMVSETERLTRLINNVLDFAKMERGERTYAMKRLDLAWLCEELIEGQRVRLEHNGFSVTFRNDAGEAFVDGDEEGLKQAVLNLISNAEKYAGPDKVIEVDVARAGDSVLVGVKDRGRGVAARDAKKIFREFYRADESLTSRTGGSGLGLPIALRIVRDHGGDIHYFPREGGGSVFQILLPLERPS